MRKDIAQFVARCLTYQKVKGEQQRPGGLVQPLEVPNWKWEAITMDFVVGLPVTSSGMNAIWVIVDRLTNVARFLAIKDTWSLEKLAEAYVKEVVRLHGVPHSITSDRDPRFLSHFWENL